MLHSHEVELAAAAAALQLLDEYQAGLEQLVRNPADRHVYARNTDQFEAIRGLTASLPLVRVCWVEVLISRFELLDDLWRMQHPDGSDPKLTGLLETHKSALQTFRRLGDRYMATAFAGRL